MCKIGLALSGGGSKGVAHIGVAQAMLEENIEIGYLAGTSSGSIVASLLAIGYTPKEIIQIFKCNLRYITDVDASIPIKLVKTIFTGKFNIKGLVKGENLEKILRKMYAKKKIKYISDVKVPLYIPVTDLKENKVIIFSNKDKIDLATVVRASCSYPGIFIPKYIYKKPYVDGGIKLNNPANILKSSNVETVVSVDFIDEEKNKQVNNIIDVVTESIDMLSEELKEKTIINSDIKIELELEKKGLLDFSSFNKYVNIGYAETKKVIPEIIELLNKEEGINQTNENK